MLHNRITEKLKDNSGFTLIELLVVLVLLGILLSVTIVGGLAWQDWAQFRHEEAVAEEIFFAAQNQMTDLDASGALNYKITSELQKGSDDTNTYNSMFYISNFENVVYAKNGDVEESYKLSDVWKNLNPQTEPGTLIKLQASAGDYEAYLDGTLYDGTSATEEKLGAKLLFDLVASYVSDKTVLNGSIIIEFSPESGQVFSVCYSDRANNLVYDDSPSDGDVSVMNRIIQEREKVMLGYYSIDQLTQKVRGRGKDAANLDFKIENDEVLQFVITDKDNELQSTDSLGFVIYDGNSNKIVMEFSIPSASIKNGTSYGEGLKAASKAPAKVKVSFPSGGLYSSEKEFLIPVFKISTGEIYVIMDAADIQAETLSYSKSVYFNSSLANSADDDGTEDPFRKTYSFYRFGLSKDVNYIYGTVCIEHRNAQNKITSSTKEADSYSDPAEGFHKNVEGEGPKGECTTFAKYVKSGNNVTIELEKVRHLFNVRYETDYKTSDRKNLKNTFVLKANMSWSKFVGDNYFLNSKCSGYVTGINYDGANISEDLIIEDNPSDTSKCPFPGFRKLDKNDTFTQGEDDKYVISDLKISITGNITYGVYDNNNEKISENCKESYASTQGEVAAFTANDSEGNNAARAGRMPLGLFAENLGTISNIILNRHVVNGLEQMKNSSRDIVYTCMVGGFAGNNIGKISNLTLLDSTGNDAASAKANISKVNGRTDVGGIVGRQSFGLPGASVEVTISGMTNYAKVSGLENIGGIVGRAYTRYVDGTEAPSNTFNSVYGSARYGDSSVSEYIAVDNRYIQYHDGYTITDKYKSMTGETVVRNNTITISDCINRGTVSGDELAYDYILNKQDLYIKTKASQASAKITTPKYCSFIGGIAGITIDGIMCDNENLKNYDDGSSKSLYETILSGFVSGSSYNIMVKNCSSFMEYNPSNASDIGDETKYKALKYDNFVGGLIGYSKLTAIKDCNCSPTEYNNKNEVPKIRVVENVPQVYVLGNRYVGGVVGCSDLTRFDTPDGNASSGLNNKTYAVTNYNNVIGKRFVGGIAGGVGSGGLEVSHAQQNPQNLDFRNPSGMSAQFISALPGESSVSVNTQILFKNVLNTGVVLCIKNQDTNSFDSSTKLPDGYCGYCGGITGAALSRISNSDNIQSESTKAFALKIVNDGDLVLDYTKPSDATKIVNELVDNSKFGGVRVGGITGYSGSGNKINASANEKSLVDAVVYGENLVGGAIGDISDSNRPTVSNVYPYKSSDNSSGMLVLGQDAVGGLFGGMPRDPEFINNNAIDSTYTVIGRYAVGGFVGVHYYEKWSHGKITSSINIEGNDTINIFGRCYTGGLVGFTSSKELGVPDSNKTINVNNLKVYSDYFAGGYAGAMLDDDNSQNNIDAITKVKYGDNVSVLAKGFAGGFVGFYSVNEISNNSYRAFLDRNDDRYSWIYDLANTKCVYDGDESLSKTYNNIVVADIGENSPIRKDSRKEEIVFSSSADVSKWLTNKASVNADLFAGGLFGFVPSGLDLTVEGFVNNGKIIANKSISSSDIKYSYLGGVIGRVPSGMKLVNCANLQTGQENYNSVATYLGGLTEVNAGLISGKTDDNGTASAADYLVNKTNFNDYQSGGIAAFAGENSGTIQYCTNKASISSDSGLSGGIAAVNNDTGIIKYCINTGTIGKDTTQKSAGIVATPSGSDTINYCRNYGKINGVSRYGIAAGVVGSISKNLEASGLTENSLAHDPVANNTSSTLTNNFYISGAEESSGSSSAQPVLPKIENFGTVSYTVSVTGDTYISPNSLYDRTSDTPTSNKVQFYLGYGKEFDFVYDISREDGDENNRGVKMKDFNVVWFPYDTVTDISYKYSIIYKYLDSEGNEKTTTVDGITTSLYGQSSKVDCTTAPQEGEITQVILRMKYDDKMDELNHGSGGTNVLYGYVYWTDTNGKHFIMRNGENLSANQGYISFNSKVYAGNSQEINDGSNYFYDRSPSSERASYTAGYYPLYLHRTSEYDYTRDIVLEAINPSTGLEMNSLKLYWNYSAANINKYMMYDVIFTYLDSDFNEQTVTYNRRFDGFNTPVEGNPSTNTLFYDMVPAVDTDGTAIYPTKVTVHVSLLDSTGNLINDTRLSDTYFISAITWIDKNGKERKIENSANKYKLNDTDPKSYVTVDTSAYIDGKPYLVSEGSGTVAADHWSKQLFVKQTSGTYNLTYKRNGEFKDNLMNTSMSADYSQDIYSGEDKRGAFDSWFMNQFIDNPTYFGPDQGGRFVDAGN